MNLREIETSPSYYHSITLDSHEMGRDVNKMEGHWFEIVVMTLMVVGQIVWVWYVINSK